MISLENYENATEVLINNENTLGCTMLMVHPGVPWVNSLKLVATCISFVFSHVCRGGNGVAHLLARLSKNFSEMKVWMEEVPNEAHMAVLSDVMI